MEWTPIKNKYNPLYNLTYDEVCERLRNDGFALQFILNQSEELCKIAVHQNTEVLKCVSDEFIHLFD